MNGSILAQADSARYNQGSSYEKEGPVVPSALASAVRLAQNVNGRLGDILGRLRILADAAGGAVPTAQSGEKLPPGNPSGHLGEMTDAHCVASKLISSIEEEIGRLEGLVG